MFKINTPEIKPSFPSFFPPCAHPTTCTLFESIHVTACDSDQSYGSPVICSWRKSLIISSMVYVLWYYLDWTAAIQFSDQLFICHGRKTQGALFFLNRQTDWPTGWSTSLCAVTGLWNGETEKCLPYQQKIVSLSSGDVTILCESKKAKLSMLSGWEGWLTDTSQSWTSESSGKDV